METQFTSSRFLETLGRLGITHRRTAYYHPEGNSYIERFHRSLKEEEVWTAEYSTLEEARASIARWIRWIPLDPGVQPRPASSRGPKSHPARGLLSVHSCTKFRGPDCLVLRGALQVFGQLSQVRRFVRSVQQQVFVPVPKNREI
jgi:hypothetical protein